MKFIGKKSITIEAKQNAQPDTQSSRSHEMKAVGIALSVMGWIALVAVGYCVITLAMVM